MANIRIECILVCTFMKIINHDKPFCTQSKLISTKVMKLDRDIGVINVRFVMCVRMLWHNIQMW